jgi:oligosaccharide reducing-end xylanase
MSLKMRTGVLAGYLLGSFVMGACASSDDATKYKIGDWGNFAKGAISHTFDDYPGSGTPNQISLGVPAFDAKDFHLTLFVQVGSNPNWETLKGVFAKGHEIASHNMSHDVSTGTFKTAQDNVRKGVPGEMCATIAYPNCNCSSDGETKKVYIAARNCGGSPNDKSPTNWAQIKSTLCGAGQSGYPNSTNELNALADNAAKANGWAVTCNHGINSGHGWANTSLDAIKGHLDYLDKNRDKIWIETFGNVARYIQERDKAKITTKTSTDNSFTITVAATGLPFDTSVFNYPLCIRREMPSGWTTATVKQGGNAVKDTIITDGSTKYIQFNAVPNGTDVVLSSGTSTACEKYLGFSASETAPVKLLNAALIVDHSRFDGSNLNVTFFNLQGKELAHYNFSASQSPIALSVEKFNHSAFLVKVAGGSKVYFKKFLPQI